MKFILDDFESPQGAETLFVDRIEPRRVFWDAYETAEKSMEEPVVLCYYGVGGVGKSTLSARLIKELKGRRPAAKYGALDFDFVERREPYRVMALLKKRLEDSWGFQFPLFEVAYYTFLIRMGEDAEQREAKALVSDSPLLSMLCDAADIIPGASAVAGILKLVDQGVSLVRNQFGERKQLLRRMETMDMRLLRDQLPIYFASDMRDNLKGEREPFVLCLDTYEKLVNELAAVGDPLQNDLWLRGSGGLIQRIPGIIWVIGGRERLKWPELDGPQWDGVLRQYLLGTLSQTDSEEFLAASGVNEAAARRQIWELSGGLPVSLDLYVEQYRREGTLPDGTAPAALHERVVRYMSDEEKNVFYLLACLGQWTRAQALDAAAAAGVPLSPVLYDKLCGFSFVLTEDGETYHLLRQVGETLKQHCPPAIRQALLGTNKEETEKKEKSAAPVITLENNPEEYVRLHLAGMESEEACIAWVLEELDAQLDVFAFSLETETFFAILGPIRQWAQETRPNGILSLWTEALDAYGLFYAGQGEKALLRLEAAVNALLDRDNMAVLDAALWNYHMVCMNTLNWLDYLPIGKRAWERFTAAGETTYAERAAKNIADIYDDKQQPEEKALWDSRCPAHDSKAESAAKAAREPSEKVARWRSMNSEVSALMEQESFSPEEADRLDNLTLEHLALTKELYGEGNIHFTYCYMNRFFFLIQEERVEDCVAEAIQAEELARQTRGENCGLTALMHCARVYADIASDMCQPDQNMPRWPERAAAMRPAYELGKKHCPSIVGDFIPESFFTILDFSGLTVSEYRAQLDQIEPNSDVYMEGLAQSVREDMLDILSPEWEDRPMEDAAAVISAYLLKQSQESEEEEEDAGEDAMTLAEYITCLMEKYQPKDLFTAFTGIPDKKMKNALRTYGNGLEPNQIYALFDATVMGSAKSGFLLVSSGMVLRLSNQTTEVLLEDIDSFTVDGIYLVLQSTDGLQLPFPCSNAKAAVGVLNPLLENLKAMAE
ncbi:MAG: hypothetical protein LUC89_03195 [Oscillospiraceae bacterium]|nr:hypothetical protein [Oscillospiraceae bacterium]